MASLSNESEFESVPQVQGPGFCRCGVVRYERMFDQADGWLPKEIEKLEPGPVLAALLSSVRVEDLSGHDRVNLMKAHQRMVSHYQA